MRSVGFVGFESAELKDREMLAVHFSKLTGQSSALRRLRAEIGTHFPVNLRLTGQSPQAFDSWKEKIGRLIRRSRYLFLSVYRSISALAVHNAHGARHSRQTLSEIVEWRSMGSFSRSAISPTVRQVACDPSLNSSLASWRMHRRPYSSCVENFIAVLPELYFKVHLQEDHLEEVLCASRSAFPRLPQLPVSPPDFLHRREECRV